MNVYITLTSYPERINTVYLTIESLLNQTFKAKNVLLWLAQEQFPNKTKDLPAKLLEYEKQGLIIKWCKDLKSYKKLIPALKEYPDDILVTADDDIIYKPNWLAILTDSFKNGEKNTVYVHRAHEITFKDNNLNEYDNWNKSVCNTISSYNNFLTTGGGCLFYPNCFHEDVLNENYFMNNMPTTDDVWFWAMLVINNVKIAVAPNNISEIICMDETQNNSLWSYNQFNKINDKNLKKIITRYPQILDKLEKKEQTRMYSSGNEKEKLRQMEKLNKILKENKDKQIVFWGASLFLEEFIQKYSIPQNNIKGIVDKNKTTQNQSLGGYKIISPENLARLNPNLLIVSIKNNNKNAYENIKLYMDNHYPYIKIEKNIFEE